MANRAVRESSNVPAVNPSRRHTAAGTRGQLRNRIRAHDDQLALSQDVFDPDIIDPVEPQVLEEYISHGRS
ncbi:hypothetical protein ACFVY1_47095 [Streptomyces sp. NPDC058293]|uniref:hypothetical protein n=1 Tax=Streptomyces sp. NPDC058293 TaxID=3346429 RepID=UPI0036F1338D